MAKIERVVKGQTPSLLDAAKANEVISKINGILESSGVEPIIVSVDDNGKLTISMQDGGLPDGYGPEEFIVCVNGSPVTRNFLTDNPDNA